MKDMRSRFRTLFGELEGPRVAVAPGRVNLIGEHTDYNEGWVLPMAIDRHVRITFAISPEPMLRAHSVGFDETCEVALGALETARGSGWFSYIAGVAWSLARSGIELAGIDLMIDSDVPIGAGLSSSAALEIACTRAMCAAADVDWQPKPMARIAQAADNEFVGIGSGIMDHLVSAAAESGCALLIDCRSLELEAVPIPADARIVVMDTGSRRALTTSAYNDRRSNCDRAVHALRRVDPEICSLRDVAVDQLEAARSSMDESVFRRASHVVAENLRPAAMAKALHDRDLKLAGVLMNESHDSLRRLYDVSSEELDLITGLAREHPGCFGARLTGAGFGGCAVALVAADCVDAFVSEVHAAYASTIADAGEFLICHPVAGAHLLSSPAQEGSRVTSASD